MERNKGSTRIDLLGDNCPAKRLINVDLAISAGAPATAPIPG